jgi:4-hydroxy-L-threonine phosphate dehydrogenase PdxA
MRIAITLGDPNGIGPEIAIKAANRFAHDPRSSRCWSATAS